MKIPPQWLKNTVDCFVRTDLENLKEGQQFTFTLKRRFRTFFGLKTEILATETYGTKRNLSESQVQNLECYKRISDLKISLDKALNGGIFELRKRALDALATNDSAEKDKFITEFLEFSENT